MYRKFIYIFCGVLACGGVAYGQLPEVKSRISGLEKNEEYMSLLKQEQALQQREDSVVVVVKDYRRMLRENPDQRQVYSDKILSLENEIFEIRNSMGRLVDRINTIEQEWVLSNLNGDFLAQESPAEQQTVVEIPEALKRRNLVMNPYFKEHLPVADYEALMMSQQKEMQAVDYANRYFNNYNTLSEMAAVYDTIPAEAEAMALYDRYRELETVTRHLTDSLSDIWNFIYDNKNYAYGYLMDELGRDDILTREDERQASAMRQISAKSESCDSEHIVDYFLRKKALVSYEKGIAELLGLAQAKDSLSGVLSQLEGVEFCRPRLEMHERYFLDYDSVAFYKTPKYSYSNPIPECKVYARGTIYRLLLGTFNTKRAVSTFRGAYPLSYLVNDAGKWCYYTGGFATRQEAEEARQELKKHGFLRPEIVVWRDGEMTNLSKEGDDAAAVNYRLEIRTEGELSDEIKAVLKNSAPDCDISRVGPNLFIIGMFPEESMAAKTVEEVRAVAPNLEIKVAEIVKE